MCNVCERTASLRLVLFLLLTVLFTPPPPVHSSFISSANSVFGVRRGIRTCGQQQRDACSSSRLQASSTSATLLQPTEVKKAGGLVEKELLPVRVVGEMPPPLPAETKNKYYLLRHGQSTANVAGIISSSRSLAGTDKHGLTPTGYVQGKESAAQLLELLREAGATPGDRVVMVSSPFARAKQTAEACLDGLLAEDSNKAAAAAVEKKLGLTVSRDVVLADGLMERNFGRLDGEALYTYAYVWPLDRMNVTHTAFDVESVAAVCHRVREVILGLEESYNNCHVVLVSHADVLQITQLYAAHPAAAGTFSSYRFGNGEVRRMFVDNTHHLPEPVHLTPPQRTTRTAA